MSIGPTAELRAAVDAVAPIVRERANEAEQKRRLTPDVVEALIGAGLMKGQAPRSLGGLEADPPSWSRTMEALGEVDASAAWCVFISGGSAPILSALPDDDVSEKLLGSPGLVIAGAFFPPGNARAVPGGYSVNGRWPFASGCEHSTAMLSICIVSENGTIREGPAGPELRLVTFPTREAKILDTWHVSGLVATGSHDFVLDDVFVPEGASFPIGSPHRGKHFGNQLYRFPFLHGIASPMAALALGIAKGAIDHAMMLAQTKVPAAATSPLRERATFQLELAEAVTRYRSARAWLYDEVDETWATVTAGEEVGIERRATSLLSAAHATRSAAGAVDLAYTASGGSANYLSSPLQRALRDVHAITQHIVTSPQQLESGIRMLLGLPPLIPLVLI